MRTVTITEKGTPCDFVYLGERLSDKGKALIVIRRLTGPRTMAEERNVYAYQPYARSWVVGGIYNGARFDADSAIGLNTAKYTGHRWHDKEAVMGWEGAHQGTRVAKADMRLEKDARRTGLIEQAMAPLNQMHRNYRRTGDYASMEALVHAVLRALRA